MNKKLVDRAKQRMRLVGEKGVETGEIAERWECHKSPGKKHLAFLVFVINGKKEFALHRRASSKVGEGKLDSPVSHVLAGETLEGAVHRCLGHEYGIAKKLPVDNYGGFSYEKDYDDGTCENEYCLVLSVEYDGELLPNKGEVEGEISFMPIKKALLESKQAPELFEVWFNLAVPVFEKSKLAKKYL
jgi:isopentenyldiphosphate isomerase